MTSVARQFNAMNPFVAQSGLLNGFPCLVRTAIVDEVQSAVRMYQAGAGHPIE
jgi:hypothetical protein